MAATKNFKIDQDSTFAFEVEYLNDDDTPIDLTGYTAKLQVRDQKGGKKLAFTLTHNDGINIMGNTGKMTISFSNVRTNKLFYPQSSYDLVITDLTGNKTRILEGFLILNRAVTI